MAKVLQNAPREHSAILFTCIKRLPVLKTNILSSFLVAALDRIYCIFFQASDPFTTLVVACDNEDKDQQDIHK